MPLLCKACNRTFDTLYFPQKAGEPPEEPLCLDCLLRLEKEKISVGEEYPYRKDFDRCPSCGWYYLEPGRILYDEDVVIVEICSHCGLVCRTISWRMSREINGKIIYSEE